MSPFLLSSGLEAGRYEALGKTKAMLDLLHYVSDKLRTIVTDNLSRGAIPKNNLIN